MMLGRRIAYLAPAACLLTAAAPPVSATYNLFGIPGLTLAGVGSSATAFMFLLYLLREWRETRKLSAEDRQARREGYAKQVESLQNENRDLRADLVANERQHDEYRKLCQLETDQLRGKVRSLEDELAGVKRLIASYSSHLAEAEGAVAGEIPSVILGGRK